MFTARPQPPIRVLCAILALGLLDLALPDGPWIRSDLVLPIAGMVIVLAVAAVVASIPLRLRRQRRLIWIELMLDAVTRLAAKREYCQISTGEDRELNALGDGFNQLSRTLQEEEIKLARYESGVRKLSDRISRLHGSLESLSRCEKLEAIFELVPQLLVEQFSVRRARIWLLHNYLPPSARGVRDEPSTSADALPSSGNILDKVGLLSVAVGYQAPELEQAAAQLRFPLRAILDAAMGQTIASHPEVRTSPLFKPHGPELDDHGYVSFLALPLVVRGKTMGVIELYSGRPFSEARARLLEVFADHAALQISSIWGLKESERSREAVELKSIEQAMANRKLERINAKLAEADRLKSEFLANTSHELRTPLNSILGFAQLILNGGCDSEAEVLEYVRTMHDSGKRLLNLINDVLDLAKIEAGKMTIELAPLEIRPLIDALVTLMKVQAAERGNTIELEIPEGILPRLRADHTRLYQVLINVLGNANKFTEKGRISISLTPGASAGFMRIEIADTGVGIPVDRQARLFQSFVQADGSTTRKFGGTGLGLAISRKIMTSLGGTIQLRSPGEGQGSVVTLEVPLWSEDLEKQWSENGAAGTPTATGSKGTVVVIEDYLEFQKHVRELLEDRGWKVCAARTASAGFDLIQTARPKAVILDMHLPSDEDSTLQTGSDLIRALGQHSELTEIPILVVTGMHHEACDELLGQTVLMPVELYSKPLNEPAFLEAIERLTAAA